MSQDDGKTYDQREALAEAGKWGQNGNRVYPEPLPRGFLPPDQQARIEAGQDRIREEAQAFLREKEEKPSRLQLIQHGQALQSYASAAYVAYRTSVIAGVPKDVQQSLESAATEAKVICSRFLYDNLKNF